MPVVEADLAVAKADLVVDSYGAERSSLIHVMQDIQQELGYLPRGSLRRVSERLHVPLAEVLRVATFYAAFSLEPRGEHLITVCMGTACHVRGAPRILEAVLRELTLKDGHETTDDMRFTVKSVRCIGCCGLAPVINIDGKAYGRLTPHRVPEILREYE
jgi:NADH:ubiquinone oxidoreductase subunit E